MVPFRALDSRITDQRNAIIERASNFERIFDTAPLTQLNLLDESLELSLHNLRRNDLYIMGKPVAVIARRL